MLELKPLAEEKREWFIGSLQWAFKQAMLDELAENEELLAEKKLKLQ
ncbi:N-acetyltransferase GCN5 [Actinobacillus equuli]|nr:N-acetyltransferase GCN5 [Actinobacillus equuli]